MKQENVILEATSVELSEEREPVSVDTRTIRESVRARVTRSAGVGGLIIRFSSGPSLCRIWSDNSALSLTTVVPINSGNHNGLYVGNTALILVYPAEFERVRSAIGIRHGISLAYDPDANTTVYTNCTQFVCGSCAIPLDIVAL